MYNGYVYNGKQGKLYNSQGDIDRSGHNFSRNIQDYGQGQAQLHQGQLQGQFQGQFQGQLQGQLQGQMLLGQIPGQHGQLGQQQVQGQMGQQQIQGLMQGQMQGPIQQPHHGQLQQQLQYGQPGQGQLIQNQGILQQGMQNIQQTLNLQPNLQGPQNLQGLQMQGPQILMPQIIQQVPMQLQQNTLPQNVPLQNQHLHQGMIRNLRPNHQGHPQLGQLNQHQITQLSQQLLGQQLSQNQFTQNQLALNQHNQTQLNQLNPNQVNQVNPNHNPNPGILNQNQLNQINLQHLHHPNQLFHRVQTSAPPLPHLSPQQIQDTQLHPIQNAEVIEHFHHPLQLMNLFPQNTSPKQTQHIQMQAIQGRMLDTFSGLQYPEDLLQGQSTQPQYPGKQQQQQEEKPEKARKKKEDDLQIDAKKKRGRPKKLILDPSTNDYIDSSHPSFKQLNKALKESFSASNRFDEAGNPLSPGAAAAAAASGKSRINEQDVTINKLFDQPTYLRSFEDDAVQELLQKKDKRGRPRKFPIEQTGVTIKGIRVNGNSKHKVKKT